MTGEVNVPGLVGRAAEAAEAPDDAAEAAYEAIRETLTSARQQVKTAVNTTMVFAYWEIGRQIVDAVGERAEYGKNLLRYLAQRLTVEFGPGFTESSLRRMRLFYRAFPIRATLSHELNWSHYTLLSGVTDRRKRDFYTREAIESGWSVRQLRRQISTLYYERLRATSEEGRAKVAGEVIEREPRTTADDLLKDPYVFEFLGIREPREILERDLEQALIDKLQDFLLELGRGFSFVGRQKRVTGSDKHYYVDLVFYNYILKCFVLIDLKVGELTHQDVGQMDFYRRIFDDKVRPAGDNPSIGIILCSTKDDAIARYSILADDVGVYASGYKTYLPSEEELRRELQREREFLEAERTQKER
ncbi:MAG TPA: PDDEXK nuclease domain-containing protein [Arachnia sp.]|nr:PDDEXK nuclease domain-containing protein [Arachnia sp.]HMT84815.1 PDDEXK nuclease domain-containing protein [Arachnia sp.]